MIPVMIVEDEFLVRVGLQSMIDWEKYGFHVVADAPNGEKALELYEIYHPALILTDIRMSKMDGLELMRRIREKDEDVHFIIISAYSEFEYAQRAIQYGAELYLNKSCFSEKDLEPVLLKIASHHKSSTPDVREEKETKQLTEVLPITSSPEEIDEWFRKNKMLDVPIGVAVCREDRSSAHTLDRSVIITVIRDVLEKENFRWKLFLHDSFIAILLSGAEISQIELLMSHICETIRQYFAVEFYAGISEPFMESQYVYQALSDACKMCNDFLFDKSTHVRSYRKEQTDVNTDKKISSICSEIETRLYASDFEGVEAKIHSAFEQVHNYRSLERLVVIIVMSFGRIDRTILVSKAVSDVMADDLKQIADSLISWSRKLMYSKEEMADRDPLDKLIDYIGEHLNEDISLAKMADKFFFSPNYLGQIFRQKIGICYNTYVTNLRINRACELLLSTDYPVGSVGQNVGIDDPHYFSKIFKERMGVSPCVYRRTWNN